MGATTISIRRALVACLFVAGCNSDQQYNPTPPDNSDGPIVEVPAAVEFGTAEADDVVSQVVTIGNGGNATLTVTSVRVESSEAFTVAFPEAQSIEPDATVDVVVDYAPLNIRDNGILVVASNDPATPEAQVALHGGALMPSLQMAPNPMTFESVGLCQTKNKELTLTNVGTADLVIDTLTPTGEGFVVLDDDLVLPLTLAPNETRSLDVRFTPTVIGPYSGEIWATTNEVIGSSSVSLDGAGAEQSRFEQNDTFRQPEGPYEKTDIFFYVDRSLSMVNNLLNLSDNFGVLLSSILSLDADYQIMVSTEDNGVHNEEIITTKTDDPEAVFREATKYVAADEYDEFTEAGLTIMQNAMALTDEKGEDNYGFIREGAKTVAVLVSDEPEQSPGTHPAAWQDLVTKTQGYAPTLSIISIAGDMDVDGCANLAEPGLGYWEAATEYTAGQFLSICTDDWAEHMRVIADLGAGKPTGTFPLSYLPDPESIVVSVGTSPEDIAPASGWIYDAAQVAVVFGDGQWPDPGAWIEVFYDLASECKATE
jgi:hypothetical protein